MKALLRGTLASLVGSVALLAAPAAFAEGEPCFNDTDCPGGGMVCGGEVCNWHKSHPAPVGDKGFVCNAAGTDKKGSDGWCTSSDNCKCKAEGATCVGTYCTFTKAADAPAGTAGAPAGTAGAPAGTAGAPAGTAGAPAGTAGAPAGTAGAPAGTAGAATAGAASSDDSGGCSVSVPGAMSNGAGLLLASIGLGFALARRRR